MLLQQHVSGDMFCANTFCASYKLFTIIILWWELNTKMTFTKPGLKYTEMAAWIDSLDYTSKYDEQKLYQYLYHLFNMVAHQIGLFNNNLEVYDEFSIYGASRLFLRLRNPKEEPIKSVLNYIKGTIKYVRADFEVEYHGYDKAETIQIGSSDISMQLLSEASYHDQKAYTVGSGDILLAINHHISKIPAKKHSAEWTNIYISCLLTLLESLTIDDLTSVQLTKLFNSNINRFREVYEEKKKEPPHLFHIPEHMSNYIKVLTQEIRHTITAEFNYEEHCNVSVDAMMKQLMIDATQSEDE